MSNGTPLQSCDVFNMKTTPPTLLQRHWERRTLIRFPGAEDFPPTYIHNGHIFDAMTRTVLIPGPGPLPKDEPEPPF